HLAVDVALETAAAEQCAKAEAEAIDHIHGEPSTKTVFTTCCSRRAAHDALLTASLGDEHEVDRADEAAPVVHLGLERTLPGGAQPVVLGLAVVLGRPPLGFHEALLLEAIERRVERA